MFDENVAADQIIAPGGTICVGAKFLGKPKVHMLSDWKHGHEGMLEETHALLSEADAVVTYNGDKFDLPNLRGEFALAGMSLPPLVPSIDVYKTARGLRLGIHKLGYVGTRFGVGAKLTHEGFNLWKSVMNGDPKAQKRMERYCAQDVRLLEGLYLRLLPYIRNHPHLNNQGRGACPSCGSMQVQSKGSRRTRAFKIQRLHCQNCGSWHDGTRTKI
jgi:hypothetical protein